MTDHAHNSFDVGELERAEVLEGSYSLFLALFERSTSMLNPTLWHITLDFAYQALPLINVQHWKAGWILGMRLWFPLSLWSYHSISGSIAEARYHLQLLSWKLSLDRQNKPATYLCLQIELLGYHCSTGKRIYLKHFSIEQPIWSSGVPRSLAGQTFREEEQAGTYWLNSMIVRSMETALIAFLLVVILARALKSFDFQQYTTARRSF